MSFGTMKSGRLDRGHQTPVAATMMMMLPYIVLMMQFLVRTVDASSMHLPPLPREFSSQRPEPRGRLMPRGGAAAAAAASTSVRRSNTNEMMPSLFDRPHEADYDMYAACLAATEGLRRLRDKELAQNNSGNAGANSSGEAEKLITAKYIVNAGKVLKAMGMSVAQFNELGRQIVKDVALKEKVMEQAYLYRMAAMIHMDRAHLLEDPASQDLLQAYRQDEDKLQMFCDSMAEIEQLRGDQMERLKRALSVDKFPSHIQISDPALLPFLAPKVRAVVEAFPLQAEQIVKKHGLQSDEFNAMLHETQANARFRWKIQKQMRESSTSDATPKQPGDRLNEQQRRSASGTTSPSRRMTQM